MSSCSTKDWGLTLQYDRKCDVYRSVKCNNQVNVLGCNESCSFCSGQKHNLQRNISSWKLKEQMRKLVSELQKHLRTRGPKVDSELRGIAQTIITTPGAPRVLKVTGVDGKFIMFVSCDGLSNNPSCEQYSLYCKKFYGDHCKSCYDRQRTTLAKTAILTQYQQLDPSSHMKESAMTAEQKSAKHDALKKHRKIDQRKHKASVQRELEWRSQMNEGPSREAADAEDKELFDEVLQFVFEQKTVSLTIIEEELMKQFLVSKRICLINNVLALAIFTV